jgi:hypothetical protein
VRSRCGYGWEICAFLLVFFVASACADDKTDTLREPWKSTLRVAGQPEPIPAQWVSTPEGKFAQSIVVPNALPRDSGFRAWMTSKQYFEHLCETEAGEFIYGTAANVKGFYFMRPPMRPSDVELKDRYMLEAPEIERTFQLLEATPQARAAIFVDPPWANFQFIEEPLLNKKGGSKFTRAFGRVQGKSQMQVTNVNALLSRYGLLWRGIKRKNDRELAIAGSEWIVIDLQSRKVLALQRDFARTGFNRNTSEGIWWLNASHCSQVKSRSRLSRRIYEFVSKSLRPVAGEHK